jgi:hypothetical protein
MLKYFRGSAARTGGHGGPTYGATRVTTVSGSYVPITRSVVILRNDFAETEL